MTNKAEVLRDIEIPWLMDLLGRSIANLGYPVGMGVPPTEHHLRSAATMLFERFVALSEALANGAEVGAGDTACPDAERMAEHACTNRQQCWEPCGDLGNSDEHAKVHNVELRGRPLADGPA